MSGLLAAVPAMPVEPAPETEFAIYTALMALTTAGFVAWWALAERHHHGPALLLVLVGGALAGFAEPWLDNVVLFRWPPEQDLAAFEAFGRTVPIFVIVGYAWFCGGLLYLTARIYERGVTRAGVWAILGAVVIVDFVAIAATDWLGIAGFFGDPPLEVAGYPLWWAAVDGVDVIAGGAVLFYLLPKLAGAARLWLVAVPPIMIGAAAGAVAWPVSTAINSQWSDPAKLAAALLTIAMGCAITHLVASVVPKRGQTPVRWP